MDQTPAGWCVAHKFLLLGISASIGLTMFVFNVVMGLSDDVSIVREDVGYIKGVISSWEENYP